MRLVIVVNFLFLMISAFSQEEQKSSFNVEGQIAVTTNLKDYFVNVGGPAIKLNFSKFAVGLNFMPSLRFYNLNNSLKVAPILGTGIQLYGLKDKRFILSIPFYYVALTNKWIGTIGIGYVLSKPKK
jgi:hypothetical protein